MITHLLIKALSCQNRQYTHFRVGYFWQALVHISIINNTIAMNWWWIYAKHKPGYTHNCLYTNLDSYSTIQVKLLIAVGKDKLQNPPDRSSNMQIL